MTNTADSENVVAASSSLVPVSQIENMIFTIRGVQVIVDRDLASLYGVETKRMNEQVRRNLVRFPSRFRFQLTKEEVDEVVANCDHLLNIKFGAFLKDLGKRWFAFSRMEMPASELLNKTT